MSARSLIEDFYRGKFAKRSGLPYMNHINEGLVVLDTLGADDDTKDAFCVHPIFQADDNWPDCLSQAYQLDTRVVILAMEYRNVANRGLSCYQVDNPDSIYLGPMPEVRQMLIADKVQNRKDFLIHHLDSHPKGPELDRYFRNWLRALDVTERQYEALVAAIEERQ